MSDRYAITRHDPLERDIAYATVKALTTRCALVLATNDVEQDSPGEGSTYR
jgi:hypothetical protein